MITWLKIVFSWLWPYLKPIAIDFATEAGKQLLSIADVVVLEIENGNITGSENKRAEAIRRIKKVAKDKGMKLGSDFSKKMLNEAIELAVRKLSEVSK